MKTKALTGVFLCFIGSFGTLLTYGLGVILNWRELAGFLSALTIPYIIGIIFIVPADQDLTDNLTTASATTSSERKRSFEVTETKTDLGKSAALLMDTNADKMFCEIQTKDERSLCQSPAVLFAQEVKSCLTSVPMWTGMIMMLFYQFGGYNVVTFYSSTIIATSVDG